MKMPLQARVTGFLPIRTMTSSDSILLDYYQGRDVDFLFSGCIDATHIMPAGNTVSEGFPRVATIKREEY
jgi:hypothetical protein